MKIKWILGLSVLLILVAGGPLISYAVAYRIPIWDGAKYIWPLLGPTLKVENGALDVVFPVSAPRMYSIRLPLDSTAGGYRFPLSLAPRNVECWVNGLHYSGPDDYTIKADLLVPGSLGNWPPLAETKVVCSYDP